MITKIENIPTELKNLRQWVCWVGSDKIPKNPHTGYNAKSNDPTTWSSFDEAVEACDKFKFDGLGFMFANGYFGVDLDHVLDDVDFCDDFVETLQSYTEISKSGSGLHILCRGELPKGARRRGKVEMYSSGRYFICTGNLYNDKYNEVKDCTETVKILHNKYLPNNTPQVKTRKIEISNLDDFEILDKARNCKSGQLFGLLYSGNWEGVYSSQSEADLALCNQLAFWTQKDKAQMDRIFRSSGLYRPKWNEKRGQETYGSITLGKACANCIDVYEPRKYEDDSSLAFAIFKNGEVTVSEDGKDYDMTDTGNAHRLLDKYGSVIRYSYNRKKWYFWDGKMWQIDDSGEVKKLADTIIEDIKKEAFSEQDEKLQADLFKWATRTASSKGKENMIKECQHLDGIPIAPEEFDACKDYLNCQNGIVNLSNGELLPHDANLMMSKICLTEYDDSGKKPVRWLKFLDEITNGDKELQEYLQRCVGYSLCGDTSEQCAYFLYGMGNNGKSTFLDAINEMLGSYSSNVQPETIMMKKFGGDGATSDIARLKSARFVTSEEPTEGVRLNEGLLKQLTGGSRITCRFLYCDEFEYTPEFKIWVATNHKPIIRGTDYGIWRRIKLIPFEVNIPKDKIDKTLKYKLREEFPQILRWAVEGCLKWKKDGIKEPEKVKQSVAEYKVEMDLLATFIEECVEIDYNCDEKVMASSLFKLYDRWCHENHEFQMTSKKFFNEISKKLPDKGRNSKGIFYKNIKLTEYAESLLASSNQFSINDFK